LAAQPLLFQPVLLKSFLRPSEMINGADPQPAPSRTQAVAFYLNHSDFMPCSFSTWLGKNFSLANIVKPNLNKETMKKSIGFFCFLFIHL
jgi:hypothetical protein